MKHLTILLFVLFSPLSAVYATEEAASTTTFTSYFSLGFQGLRLKTRDINSETSLQTRSYVELNAEGGMKYTLPRRFYALGGLRFSRIKYGLIHKFSGIELAEYDVETWALSIPAGIGYNFSPRLYANLKIVPKFKIDETQKVKSCNGICNNESRSRSNWWFIEPDINYRINPKFSAGLGYALPLTHHFKGDANIRHQGFIASLTFDF